ncbi:MAG: hypothetical protein ACI4MF_09490 [Candidatus Faecivicinus sp.]
MKRLIALALAMLLCCTAAFAEERGTDEQLEPPAFGDGTLPEPGDGERAERGAGGPGGNGEKGQGGPGQDGGNRGNGAGGMTAAAEPDEALQAILDEVQDKFQLLSFTDPESGIELQYQLFVPEDYSEDEEYPLIMFIPDSRAPGREASFVLTIGWGGVVWATADEQAKHPCFVMVPVFTETVVDDNFNTSDQIDVAVRIIENLTENYSIDTNRLYTTGQSMGGMTSFHLNVKYPDLFAASLFVGSQWDNTLLDVLEEDSFFYIVSAGDDKASTGQTGLMEVFDADGASYAHAEWSAQDDEETQNAAVEALIAEGCQANFVTFTKGTTLTDGAGGSEHLTSFDYAYKLEAVRDWLFEQSK